MSQDEFFGFIDTLKLSQTQDEFFYKVYRWIKYYLEPDRKMSYNSFFSDKQPKFRAKFVEAVKYSEGLLHLERKRGEHWIEVHFDDTHFKKIVYA